MRSLVLSASVLALTFVAGFAVAQRPNDGDLVFSLLDSNTFQNGAVVYVNPQSPAGVTTLTTNLQNNAFHNWVRMAPNNSDVVVAEIDSAFAQSNLLSISPGGFPTTIIQGIPGGVNGYALDGDDTWIVAAANTSLFGVNHSSGALSSFILVGPGLFNDVAILREAGIRYVIADFQTTSAVAPKVLGADRNGITTTILSAANTLNRISSIEVDPKTGDLLTGDFDGPTTSPPEPNGGVEFNRVSRNGQVTPLTAFVGANAVKVNPDDTAWIAGFVVSPSLNTAVMRYDLAGGAVITIVSIPAISTNPWSISGLDVYGSRPLTCNGQGGPNSTINITIKSQRPRAAAAAYQLALSFGRRPGVKTPNGERLHLDVTDALFALTVQNLAPFLFQKFSGVLNVVGAAQAKVRLPATFPSGLGLTVFCAGVIFDQAGVVQVTNTHWFEL